MEYYMNKFKQKLQGKMEDICLVREEGMPELAST
jgi:hypothetical protein